MSENCTQETTHCADCSPGTSPVMPPQNTVNCPQPLPCSKYTKDICVLMTANIEGVVQEGQNLQEALTSILTYWDYEIGQYVESEGGVVFHRWSSATPFGTPVLNGVKKNYLIVDTENLTDSIWSDIDDALIGASAQSWTDGLANSLAIVAQTDHTTSAAKLCLDSTRNSKTDWYLPASHELSTLIGNALPVNIALQLLSDYDLIPNYIDSGNFPVSSTESSATTAIGTLEYTNIQQSTTKNGTYKVRAIRKVSI